MQSPAAEGKGPAIPIRSYVLRRSHFSAAQRDAYDRLMPTFGVAFSKSLLDLPTLFGRTAPTILEIGFGMGDTTAEIAASRQDHDFLAVDVHTPGIGALLKRVQAQGLTNIRIVEHDAREVVEFQVPDDYLTGIHVFFPDPWPKARHHKRRLIQTQFVRKLATKLSLGGYLHLATDWPDYADQMREAVGSTTLLRLLSAEALSTADMARGVPASPSARHPPSRPTTRFEQRGLALGHPIADIVAVRIAVDAHVTG